jgi:hypothetical protein
MLRSVAVAPLKIAAGALAVAALPTMLAVLGGALLVGSLALVTWAAPLALEQGVDGVGRSASDGNR